MLGLPPLAISTNEGPRPEATQQRVLRRVCPRGEGGAGGCVAAGCRAGQAACGAGPKSYAARAVVGWCAPADGGRGARGRRPLTNDWWLRSATARAASVAWRRVRRVIEQSSRSARVRFSSLIFFSASELALRSSSRCLHSQIKACPVRGGLCFFHTARDVLSG